MWHRVYYQIGTAFPEEFGASVYSVLDFFDRDPSEH
jgi:hypothetical protein